MPTKRTKRSRNRRGVPAELRSVFGMGMGWNHLDAQWLREQWQQYGRAFLEGWTAERQPFALVVLGEPEQGEQQCKSY